MHRRLRVCGSLALLMLFVPACLLPGGSFRINSSHFAFPSSNVYPMNTVEGKASKLCGILFINWGSPDADLMNSAVNDALSKAPGSSMIINMQSDSKLFMIPALFALCITNVMGTAARVVIGEQDLGQYRSPQQPSAPPTPAPQYQRPPAAPAAPAPTYQPMPKYQPAPQYQPTPQAPQPYPYPQYSPPPATPGAAPTPAPLYVPYPPGTPAPPIAPGDQ